MAVICALAATGYWFAMRSQLNHALDQGLRYRLIGLVRFLESVEPAGQDEIAFRLEEVSPLGELYLVYGEDGTLIAQSDGLARHGVQRGAAEGPRVRDPLRIRRAERLSRATRLADA